MYGSLTAGEEHGGPGCEDARRVELVVEVFEVRVAGQHPVEDGEGSVHCRGILHSQRGRRQSNFSISYHTEHTWSALQNGKIQRLYVEYITLIV